MRFTRDQYLQAIAALRDGLSQLEPDGRCCGICGDSGHMAWECGKNPLLAMALCEHVAATSDALHETLHALAGYDHRLGVQTGPARVVLPSLSSPELTLDGRVVDADAGRSAEPLLSGRGPCATLRLSTGLDVEAELAPGESVSRLHERLSAAVSSVAARVAMRGDREDRGADASREVVDVMSEAFHDRRWAARLFLHGSCVVFRCDAPADGAPRATSPSAGGRAPLGATGATEATEPKPRPRGGVAQGILSSVEDILRSSAAGRSPGPRSARGGE